MEKIIHIQMLSEDALIYLKTNIKSIAPKIEANDSNKWVEKEFPQPMFIEKKLEIVDFELQQETKSDEDTAELDNSIKLYEHLKNLPRYILSDERFWLWLHFEKFYPVVKSMMKIRGDSTIENMWMHTQGNRRGLMFGVLSRCFFRVALTIDNTKADKYYLTKWVNENPLRYRNLTWRSLSSESHLVRGILRGEKQVLDDFKINEKNDLYTEIAKYVSSIGSVRLLDVISEDDICQMVYDKMIELYKREGIIK